MEFIDREKEQERFRRALNSDKPEFIVLYGRRRLGKSTLIRRILKKNDIYFEASRKEKSIQISMLAHTISSVYPGFDSPDYQDWEDIILAFNYRCEPNATLVLDEFPFLVQKDSALPSTLQRILDRRIIGGEGLRCNIIICGSSQRMMHSLLKGSEPLYGRADEEFSLRPISLPYWSDATGLNAKALIEEYSVWGGVPQYWTYREKYRSLNSALRGLIFDEQGKLYNEPDNLFRDEATDIASYSSIMSAIGYGNHRYSDIANAMRKSTTELYKPMGNLQEMNYIRKEVPFGENEKKTKKTLYQIDDPYLAFYYSIAEPLKPLLAMRMDDIVKAKFKEQYPMHVGRIWERLCQTAVSGRNLFGHTWYVASRWWGKVPVYEEEKKTPIGNEDIEFDVVAQDYNDKNTILVGECKWASANYADRLLEKLKAKTAKAPFAKGKNIVYVLFLREQPKSQPNCDVMLPDDVIKTLPI